MRLERTQDLKIKSRMLYYLSQPGALDSQFFNALELIQFLKSIACL